MGAYTSDNALHEKVVKQANSRRLGRRLSAENFDRENVDELIKLQIFPCQKFAPYGIYVP